MPQLGFGLAGIDTTATRAIEQAIEVGYRPFDCAPIYGNEEGLGRAVATSGVPREEFFITTKVWKDSRGRQGPASAIDESLDRLRLDYVDLFLIHWPHPALGLMQDTWASMEEVAGSGKTRTIGVANFRIEDLELIRWSGMIPPAVDQVELHPLFPQRELRVYLEEVGVRVQAWAPLAQGKVDLASLPHLGAIAESHGKSIAQVVLRWHIQQGRTVFPKSSTLAHIQANFQIFDFELTPADIERIDTLDEGWRLSRDPAAW